MSCAHSAICYLSVPNIRINHIDEIKGVVGGYSKICLKCSQIDNIGINFCDWICSVFFYEAVVVTLTINMNRSAKESHKRISDSRNSACTYT